MAAKYELDLRDYIRILKKRKYTILFSAVVMGIFSFVFARMQEPTPIYQASAGVKIEKSTSMAGLYMESMAVGEGDNLETQAQIIKSYPIMEIVAKKIGKLDPNLTTDEIRQNNDLLNQVLELKTQVETEREGFTNLINITVTSFEPKFSQKLANTVAEAYKEQNIKEKNKRADDAVSFIGNQLKVVKGRMTEAEEKLKEYRENNKLISLDTQSRITLESVTQKETLLSKLESGIKEIQSMVHSLENKDALSTKSVEGGIFADQTSPSFLRLNDQLSNLRVSMDTLQLVYTENHPEVIEVKSQIEKICGNMLKELTAQLRTMEKRKGELLSDLNVAREQFQNLPQSGLNLARLERDVKLQYEVYALLEQKYQEALIRQAEKVEEVTIVKPALEPYEPINPPNTASTAFIGIILGMTLGLVFSFISETLDTSIGTIEDVEEFIGVPVIGIIPFVSEEEVREILLKKADTTQVQDEEVLGRNARLVSHFAPHSTLAESYRTLRTNIQFASLEKNAKVLLFTSSSPKEGKSTTTSNVAMTMAQVGLRTLLIDADMRKPMVNKIFGLEREPGLSDILIGNCEIEESIKTVTDIMMGKMGMEDIMKTPGIDNLNIITSGVIPPNPSELLNSPRMTEFIATVREMYDVVIFDTTPVLPATDAAVLGSKVDSVILVYKAGQIARGALKRAKVQMDNVNAKILGVVLNALKSEVSSDFQDYRYDTYYSYGAEHLEEPETVREKLEVFFRTTYEKFEQYTAGKNVRRAILGVCLALMFSGVLIGESQRTGFIPKYVTAEKEGDQESPMVAGAPGMGPTQTQDEGKPGEGPRPGESLDGSDAGGGFSFLTVLIVLLLLGGIGYAVRWYLLSKKEEEGDEEDEEAGEGDKDDSEGEEKDARAGVKHVDLSLDLSEGAAQEGISASGSPVFEIPAASIGIADFGAAGAAGQGAVPDFSFSLPDLNAPQGEIPGMEGAGAFGAEGGLPDFKFSFPGMEEEIPPPATPAPPAQSFAGYTEETVIDSSFKGFAKPERFGELDGEELPDFSEFGKIDFEDESKEEKYIVEEIKAVPHPEGGALESFPEERTGAPSVEEAPSLPEPALEIPTEAVESIPAPRAITWDTTPLRAVDTPMNGLSSFSEEAGEPVEESPPFEFSGKGEDLAPSEDWGAQPFEEAPSLEEMSFLSEEFSIDKPSKEEFPQGDFGVVAEEGILEDQALPIEEIPAREEIFEVDIIEGETGMATEALLAPLEEIPAEAEILEAEGEIAEEAEEFPQEEGILEGDILESDILESEVGMATEALLAPLEEIPVEAEMLEAEGEIVEEAEEFPQEEGILEGDILENEVGMATETLLAPLEEIHVEAEILEAEGEIVEEAEEFPQEEGILEGDILESEVGMATEALLAPLEEIPVEA
ncbi:MAG: polysaccharide biosynthesis tyrosine autokinase, partial [Nitrospinae bacterium]|nr:polysaccharide biosynthesis tyrosine autokinase [Nitrospinota bacterium]